MNIPCRLFGYKLYIDQNEKLVMYGVTHVCIVDGYSGEIVGLFQCQQKTMLKFTHIFTGTSLICVTEFIVHATLQCTGSL